MQDDKIETFVINLERRPERKVHIQKQFQSKKEYNLHFVKAIEHDIPAVGLWMTLNFIIRSLTVTDCDYILILEDDHEFTANYSISTLTKHIRYAQTVDCNILLGGVSSIRSALKKTSGLVWTEKFSGLQFSIIFRNFFQSILDADFKITDVADYKLSSMTSNKLIVYPFLSIQKEFGYSDVTPKNNSIGRVNELFVSSERTIGYLLDVRTKYASSFASLGNIFTEEELKRMRIAAYMVLTNEYQTEIADISLDFSGKDEFDIHFIESNTLDDSRGISWITIREVIQLAKADDDDVVLICTGQHSFTSQYSRKALMQNVVEAHAQGADLLYGVVNHFDHAVPLSDSRFWIDANLSTQFFMVYRKFFDSILNEPFDESTVSGYTLSELTSNKMTVFPFISMPRYSATDSSRYPGNLTHDLSVQQSAAESRLAHMSNSML